MSRISSRPDPDDLQRPIDEAALQCRYCHCTPLRPCLLNEDTRERVTAGWSRRPERTAPCGWHRIVELVHARLTEGSTLEDQRVDYFACCDARECVRAYLADQHAP